MKKRIISFLLCFVIIFYITVPYQKANAAAAEITLAAAAAAMVASASGMSWIFSGPSTTSQTYLQRQMEAWVADRDITELFGNTIAKKVATKMIIPVTAYNAIKDFLNYYKTENGIGGSSKVISGGVGQYSTEEFYDDISVGQYTALEYGARPGSSENLSKFYWIATVNGNQVEKVTGDWPKASCSNLGFGLGYNSWNQLCFGGFYRTYDGDKFVSFGQVTASDKYEIKAQVDNWNPPNVDVGYQWEGNLTGAMPDTNLQTLIYQIFDKLQANDINATGEVTEAEPEPTPAPTTPPAEDILEGINDIIGQLDNIKEGVGEITGSMTETIEGTAEAVESIEGTLSDALAMPDSEELPDFKFDLRELFPFCIPFDIYNLLSRFDASPTAPHVQIPFNIASIGFEYNIDLDFSAFDSVAEIMRTVEFIVYAIGLALVTGKVIKW